MAADPLCGSSLAVKDVSLPPAINPAAVGLVLGCRENVELKGGAQGCGQMLGTMQRMLRVEEGKLKFARKTLRAVKRTTGTMLKP